MPFVTKEHRDNPDFKIPGDRTYVWYKWMVMEWEKEERWTTADRLYSQVCEYHKQRKLPVEQLRALDLAWQVFFVFKVVPYEEKMQQINGDVESIEDMIRKGQ